MTEDNEYSTGELAEACGTTVRTVQYYDQKGLLTPSGYSDGGRRLYTEEDASRLRFILMLKSLGLKLAQIKGILESPSQDAIFSTLLGEQSTRLQAEIEERSEMLKNIELIRSDIKHFGMLRTTSIPAMDARMDDKKARRRWFVVMLVLGLLVDAAWIGAVVYGIVSGVWWPLIVALVFAVVVITPLVRHYDEHVTYLCPVCEADFRPRMVEFFFANHTPKTRKLTCPCCGSKDWCIEHYHAEPEDIAPGECVPGTCRQPAAVASVAAEGGDER